MATKLSTLAITVKCKTISQSWHCDGKSIRRNMVFQDFVDAFSFMTSVAIVAEKINHHPSWQNVYNRLSIELSTHDVGGLTDKDFHLAKKIDNLMEKLSDLP